MSVEKHGELFGIQMLRGAAAIAVVIHHALEMSNGSPGRFSPNWLTTSGAAGVDVFFVISGFIMVYTSFKHGRPAVRPVSFLINRATRIYPFYWVCLLMMASVYASGVMKNHTLTAGSLFFSALLFPGDQIIGVAWTLSYEVFFYLMFAASLSSRSKWATCLLAILGIVLSLVAGKLLNVPFFANPIMLEFCLGMALAHLATGGSFVLPVGLIGIVAAIMAIIAPAFLTISSTAGPDGWTRLFAWGLPAFFIVAAGLTHGRPTGLIGRTAVLIGNASYSIYLTHVFGMIAYGWAIKATWIGQVNQIPMVAAIVLGCAIVGILVHIAVEAPMTRMFRVMLRPAPPPIPAGHRAQ